MKWGAGSQQEMEASLQEYFETLTTAQAGQFNAMLNPHLVGCDYAKQSLTVSMYVQPWMVNPAGIMHGGVAASILDFAMGLLSRMCAGGALTPTVSFHIDYLRSTRAEDMLFVEAVCNKCGAHLSYITARAWNGAAPDKTVLSAAASYYTASGR